MMVPQITGLAISAFDGETARWAGALGRLLDLAIVVLHHQAATGSARAEIPMPSNRNITLQP